MELTSNQIKIIQTAFLGLKYSKKSALKKFHKEACKILPELCLDKFVLSYQETTEELTSIFSSQDILNLTKLNYKDLYEQNPNMPVAVSKYFTGRKIGSKDFNLIRGGFLSGKEPNIEKYLTKASTSTAKFELCKEYLKFKQDVGGKATLEFYYKFLDKTYPYYKEPKPNSYYYKGYIDSFKKIIYNVPFDYIIYVLPVVKNEYIKKQLNLRLEIGK